MKQMRLNPTNLKQMVFRLFKSGQAVSIDSDQEAASDPMWTEGRRSLRNQTSDDLWTCIQVRHLGKSYGTGHTERSVLEDCSFEMQAGRLNAIIGKSGSGKTTLLKILAGLIESDAGDVIVDGIHLNALNRKEREEFRAMKIGFVFQNYELLSDYTASENIRMVSDLQGKPPNPEYYQRLIRLLNLQEAEERFPEELSGGEQQRVAIARALYGNPAIILADEPTGNLDAWHSREVFSLLQQSSRQLGQTVIMVTHDLGLARQADAVFSLENGRVRAYG